jgi:hypothetical protein
MYPISSEFFINLHRNGFWDAFTKKLPDSIQKVIAEEANANVDTELKNPNGTKLHDE